MSNEMLRNFKVSYQGHILGQINIAKEQHSFTNECWLSAGISEYGVSEEDERWIEDNWGILPIDLENDVDYDTLFKICLEKDEFELSNFKFERTDFKGIKNNYESLYDLNKGY